MIVRANCEECHNIQAVKLELGKKMSTYYLAVFICQDCGQANLVVVFTRMIDQYQVYALEESPIKDKEATDEEEFDYMEWAIGCILHRPDVREHFSIGDEELVVIMSAIDHQVQAMKEAILLQAPYLPKASLPVYLKLPSADISAKPISDEEAAKMGKGFGSVPSDKELGL